MHKHLLTALTVLVIAFSGAAAEEAYIRIPPQQEVLQVQDLPDVLKGWDKWALDGYKKNNCSIAFNNAKEKFCYYISELSLDIKGRALSFTQKAAVLEDGFLLLPGSAELFPSRITVNGKETPVINRGNLPYVQLAKGRYVISGTAKGKEAIRHFAIPEGAAILSVRNNGSVINSPTIENGTLRLETQTGAKKETDAMNVQTFRNITDGIPMFMTLYLDISVTGSQRAENFGGIIPDNFTLMSVSGNIPAHIQKNGDLIAEVRPGNWNITVMFRQIKESLELSTETMINEQEIWVLTGAAGRRVIQAPSNLSAIQTKNTNMPPNWKSLPAYEVKRGESVILTAIDYNTPLADKLSLNRDIKLSFDGSFFAVRDNINATFQQDGRFSLTTPFKLSSAEINGEAQAITDMGGKSPGIEIRKGTAAVTAISRISASEKAIPASGYDRDFDNVYWRLYLSPGYKLFAVSGADKVSDTWLSNWNLLGIFTVVLMGVIFYYLFGTKKALLGLLAFILLHPVFPGFVLISFVLCIFVFAMRYLAKDTTAYKTAAFIKTSLMIFLGLATLGFMISHLRMTIYPVFDTGYPAANPLQTLISPYFLVLFYFGMAVLYLIYRVFANPLRSMWKKVLMTVGIIFLSLIVSALGQAVIGNGWWLLDYGSDLSQSALYGTSRGQSMDMGITSEEAYYNDGAMERKPYPAPMPQRQKSKGSFSKNLTAVSKDAVMEMYQSVNIAKNRIQTGVGFPNWQGRATVINLNGKITVKDEIKLYLISPPLNLFISLIQLVLSVFVLYLLGEFNMKKRENRPVKTKTGTKANPLLAFIIAMSMSFSAMAADVPNNDLLKELQARMTREYLPSCLPSCASIPEGTLTVKDNDLTLTLNIQTVEDVVIPLPALRADGAGFIRITGITVNGREEPLLIRNKDVIRAYIKKGVNTIEIKAVLDDNADRFSITPAIRINRLDSSLAGFALNESQTSAQSFQINRTRKKVEKEQVPSQARMDIAPFFEVTRTLDIGTLWQVTTAIRRTNQLQDAATVDIPLLAGEKVISAEGELQRNFIRLSFAPNERVKEFTSLLPVERKISLAMPETISNYGEIWRLNIDTDWSFTRKGIAPVADGSSGVVFRPAAGEVLEMEIFRPDSMDGEVITFDQVNYNVTSARQTTTIDVALQVRASESGNHNITLPDNAKVKELFVNGNNYPIVQKGKMLNVPVNQGNSRIGFTVEIPKEMNGWFSFPEINLNGPAVNIHQQLALTLNRWVLFTGGPAKGPAVLFWSHIPIFLLLSFVLGRMKNCPVKTWQWFILLLGLSQSRLMITIIVVAWFIIIALRDRFSAAMKFKNLFQIFILAFSALFIYCLFIGVNNGLLGVWDMKIAGGGSYLSWNGEKAWFLKWYQDASMDLLPTPLIISLPIWIYRLLMVAWSSWLAFSFIRWVKWAAQTYVKDGLWRHKEKNTA